MAGRLAAQDIVRSTMGNPGPLQEISLISYPAVLDISEIKLIRTDTTLDLSQKAEKVCSHWAGRPAMVGPARVWGAGGKRGTRKGKNSPRLFARSDQRRPASILPHSIFQRSQKENGGSTRKRISPPLPKIVLCASPHWGPALLSRHTKCKVQQPNSRTACVITVSTQPGMLPDPGAPMVRVVRGMRVSPAGVGFHSKKGKYQR